MPHNEALELISRCIFLVLPSRSEAMGRVLMESMAQGKPVIASNVDGIPYYVRDNVNGVLFQSEDCQDLTAKMERLLGDKSLRKRLGDNGHSEVSRKYTEDHYLDVYSGMLNSL